jgi:hypothetical protein
VGEPRGLPDDHPYARTPVSPRCHVFDPAVVEPGRSGPTILGEHLGELPAGAQGDTQH